MQQQQPKRTHFSLNRRRGTLAGAAGGGGQQLQGVGANKTKRAPRGRALLVAAALLAAALAAAAFLFIVSVAIARRSELDDRRPPSRSFLAKKVGGHGEPKGAAELRGGAVAAGSGSGSGTAGGGGDEADAGRPGVDLAEPWRARVRDSHAAKFRLAGERREPDPQGQEERRKRRISDALGELHERKREEMARAIEERIGEQKLGATRRLLHRHLPRY